ncbi:unnamed protein product, partial [Ectocarpus sp. 12 AP-2014]
MDQTQGQCSPTGGNQDHARSGQAAESEEADAMIHSPNHDDAGSLGVPSLPIAIAVNDAVYESQAEAQCAINDGVASALYRQRRQPSQRSGGAPAAAASAAAVATTAAVTAAPFVIRPPLVTRPDAAVTPPSEGPPDPTCTWGGDMARTRRNEVGIIEGGTEGDGIGDEKPVGLIRNPA